MQVAAVDDRVRVAEADAERLVERNVGDLLPAHGIHEAQVVDIDRDRARCVPDSQIVEAMKGVGAELNAGSDLPERRRLLQHDRRDALLREPDRRSESADTATRNDDRFRGHG